MTIYADQPVRICEFKFDLPEVMYYLYLPVRMPGGGHDIRLPPNVECCRPMIEAAINLHLPMRQSSIVYLSARKGWASPDNPLNRPGWHCDGFGTADMNYIWWTGPGTRFTRQKFRDISEDHIESLKQFDRMIYAGDIYTPDEKWLYGLSPRCVHSTPEVKPPGCMRQFVKISLSMERYNLENNSHNYLFDYDWPMHSRDVIRNDTHKAQLDYVA
jgi:hypothetical protein